MHIIIFVLKRRFLEIKKKSQTFSSPKTDKFYSGISLQTLSKISKIGPNTKYKAMDQ